MSSLAERLVDDGLQAAQELGAVFRYVDGMVIPYGKPTDVGLYLEEFQRGAFTASLAEHHAVPLLNSHDRSNVHNVLGVAEEWDDTPQGLYARFRLALTPVAQTAGLMARDGFATGLSVGFSPVQSTWKHVARDKWNPDAGPHFMDRVVRTAARLHEVSLCVAPAYVGARVMAVHADPIT